MRLGTDRLRLELSRSRRPAMQVAFLAACFLFAGWVILKNQYYDRPWQEKITVQVEFADVKGVTPGVQRVRIAGLDVGTVSDSRIVDGRPVLTLKIRKKYGPLYRNARMRLRPLSPLQDMYVSIDDRGTPSGGRLSEDDVLPARQNTTPVDISRVLNGFPADTRARMRILLHQFGRGLDDNGEQLSQAFAQTVPFLQAVRQTSRQVSVRRTQMARLVHNLGVVTAGLGKRDRQLNDLVRGGSATLGELAAADASLGATIHEIPPTLAVMRRSFAALRAAEDELDPALGDLRPVAANLRRGLDALERFSADATPALRAASPAVQRLAPLARNLRPTSAALEGSFRSLSPSTPRIDRITAQTVPCLEMIGRFFNDTLSVLKFSDGYGAFPRGDNTVGLDTFGGQANTSTFVKSRPCTGGRP